MDWADEHYVKLYSRDTVTWKLWPWQARALLPLLERKVDAAGFLPCGMHDPAKAVAAIVEIPLEVVKPGLDAMLETGTVELVDRQLLLVNFVAAQESRKTDKAKARDYRERKKAHARAEASAKLAKPIEVAVTARHAASPDVTPTNPPALLCSALPEKIAPTPEASTQPKPPKKPSAQQEFFRWTQAAACGSDPHRLPEREPDGPVLNTQLKAPLTSIGRLGLEAAWRAYERDPFAKSKGLPWGLFVSKIPELHNKTPLAAVPKSRTLAPGEDPYADQLA